MKKLVSTVSVHGKWKQKLRKAIDTGECESTPDKVKLDSNCSFGKWLYRRIEPDIKSSPYYTKVVDLHAKFHKEAGEILGYALNGDKEKARELMVIGANFSNTQLYSLKQ